MVTHPPARGLDQLFQRSIPADEHPEALSVVEDGREGLDEVLETFLLVQPADATSSSLSPE